MIIPYFFDDFIICIPDKGILDLEINLYNSIGITNDNILWIEANTDIINSNQSNVINAVISDKDNDEYLSIFEL